MLSIELELTHLIPTLIIKVNPFSTTLLHLTTKDVKGSVSASVPKG